MPWEPKEYDSLSRARQMNMRRNQIRYARAFGLDNIDDLDEEASVHDTADVLEQNSRASTRNIVPANLTTLIFPDALSPNNNSSPTNSGYTDDEEYHQDGVIASRGAGTPHEIDQNNTHFSMHTKCHGLNKGHTRYLSQGSSMSTTSTCTEYDSKWANHNSPNPTLDTRRNRRWLFKIGEWRSERNEKKPRQKR